MSGPYPSTAGNAVPNVDGTDLGDLLDDLRGIHPGLDLILDGYRLLAHDRHDLNTTQVLIAALAGSPDAVDATALPGLAVERLSNPDTNPALRSLPLDQQKTAAHQGWLTSLHLIDPTLRDTAASACAALDHPTTSTIHHHKENQMITQTTPTGDDQYPIRKDLDEV